jgi:inner membrane protein
VPSLLGHAIIGASAARLASPVKSPRRLYVLSLVSSIVPDLDGVGFVFGIQYDSFFGHRGFFHSIAFSLVTGVVLAAIYLKSIKIKSPAQAWWILYFTCVTLSHPVLDAMTTGGHGIAFFSPFITHRYFYFFRPIFVSPLSVSDFFSLVGVRVLISEALILGIPCLAMILLAKVISRSSILRVTQISVSVILIGFFSGIVREELIPSINGVDVYKIEPTLSMGGKHGLRELPTEDLPGKRLIVNYNELRQLHLFNEVLIPKKIPWSGSFFPVWLGGATGRWQEPYLAEVWKSLWGDTFFSKHQLMELLPRHSSELLRASPTEKYDIAVGDYYLSATRAESTVRGRGYLNINPNTPMWAGYCNSISTAALFEKEPIKAVTVLNPDGYEITFYPNDLKALLGIAYLFPSSPLWDLGNRCQLDGPKNEDCIDVNPAALVIALTNLLGSAKTSFLINKYAFNSVSNVPIRNAEIRIVNPPYFPGDRSPYFEVDDLFIKALVDVEIHLTVSHISALPGEPGEEDLIYRATLGLDAKMNLAGGRWEDPFHHPDFAFGSLTRQLTPALFGSFIKANVKIEWSVLKAILEESASPTPQLKPLEISKISSEPVMHGLGFSSEADGIFGRISYLRFANPIEIYGHLEGKEKNSVISAELIITDEKTPGSPDRVIAPVQFLSEPSAERRFFKIKASGSLEDRVGVKLRLNKKDGSIEFDLPTKRKFESRLDPSVGYP